MHLELFTDFCANVNRFRQNEIIFVIRILTCWPENCIVDEKGLPVRTGVWSTCPKAARRNLDGKTGKENRRTHQRRRCPRA